MPDNRGKNTGTHLLRSSFIVENSKKYFVSRQQCTGNPLLHFDDKTEQSIFVTYVNVDNSGKGTYLSFPWQQWLKNFATYKVWRQNVDRKLDDEQVCYGFRIFSNLKFRLVHLCELYYFLVGSVVFWNFMPRRKSR
jgi:hypothetical protein